MDFPQDNQDASIYSCNYEYSFLGPWLMLDHGIYPTTSFRRKPIENNNSNRKQQLAYRSMPPTQ